MKRNSNFWVLCCSTCEGLSIGLSITNVGLMLTKLRDFSSSPQVKIQVKIQFRTFEEIKFLGFHAVVLVKTFPFTKSG